MDFIRLLISIFWNHVLLLENIDIFVWKMCSIRRKIYKVRPITCTIVRDCGSLFKKYFVHCFFYSFPYVLVIFEHHYIEASGTLVVVSTLLVEVVETVSVFTVFLMVVVVISLLLGDWFCTGAVWLALVAFGSSIGVHWFHGYGSSPSLSCWMIILISSESWNSPYNKSDSTPTIKYGFVNTISVESSLSLSLCPGIL